MTEEAFIRTLIDQPGEDTPRLVYADWLDDHGDPARADYLRVEAAWAASWRTGTPPGWSARVPSHAPPEWEAAVWPGLDDMLARTTPFDPLWVARVSRPPVGVCCDHLRFRDAGPPLTRAEIEAAAKTLGYRFPPALVAFLLHTNGGVPDGSQMVYRCGSDEEGWGWDWLGVDSFAGLETARGRGADLTIADHRGDIEDYESGDGFGEDDVTARYVPFGKQAGPTLFVISTSPPRAGGGVPARHGRGCGGAGGGRPVTPPVPGPDRDRRNLTPKNHEQ